MNSSTKLFFGIAISMCIIVLIVDAHHFHEGPEGHHARGHGRDPQGRVCPRFKANETETFTLHDGQTKNCTCQRQPGHRFGYYKWNCTNSSTTTTTAPITTTLTPSTSTTQAP